VTSETGMDLSLSFKFVDDVLNKKLIGLVKKAGSSHSVDDGGAIHYSPNDEETMENDLIGAVRSLICDPWQVLTCPQNWVEIYRQYMIQHNIPFSEELMDDQMWFIIPGKYRPQAWKLSTNKKPKKKASASTA
jgi:hypothetical protein